MIDIFKFGGASINSAERIQQIAQIVQSNADHTLVLVISASGKMTNAFEKLLDPDTDIPKQIDHITEYHRLIINDLKSILPKYNFKLKPWIADLQKHLIQVEDDSYNQRYDQIVSFGELISTNLVKEYFECAGISVKWLDARKLIHTDSSYREASVNWETSCKRINQHINKNASENIYITQGFIASDDHGQTTTLGREGSDFTAAILGHCLNASSVTIWKDVPGVLNADPRLFTETELIEQLSYKEAIEMTYYGAQVIHPKTIKPLQNKSISLHVRSFLDPDSVGTVINKKEQQAIPPIKVIKHKQCLWQISTRDFAFIVEDHLSMIYKLFAQHKVKINVLQNTAISLSICLDDDLRKNKALLQELKLQFDISETKNLELLTIRHFTNDLVDQFIDENVVLLEERIRQTCRLVIQGSIA